MVFEKGHKINNGRKFTKEHKKKLGRSKEGSKNPKWKGNNAKYNALHIWVRSRKKKPEFCENCNKKPPYDLSNISGKYKRDVKDWEYLCRSCHMKRDGRMNNLKQFNKKQMKKNRFFCYNCDTIYEIIDNLDRKKACPRCRCWIKRIIE